MEPRLEREGGSLLNDLGLRGMLDIYPGCGNLGEQSTLRMGATTHTREQASCEAAAPLVGLINLVKIISS